MSLRFRDEFSDTLFTDLNIYIFIMQAEVVKCFCSLAYIWIICTPTSRHSGPSPSKNSFIKVVSINKIVDTNVKQ